MKRFFYLLASAALLLSSCSKDEEPYLKINPESLSFDGGATTQSVLIESNTTWEISGTKDWVSINKTSGQGDETINITVIENDGLDRECSLNFTSSATVATLKISQTGRPNLSVSEQALTFDSKAAEKEITLKTNKDWTVQNSCDWITVTPSSGKASDSEQTVKIEVSANTDVDRAGELVFSIGSEGTEKVAVSQSGSVIEYAGVKYGIAKMKDGRVWMTENLRYVPEGFTPSNDLKNVKAGVYYPIVMNSAHTAVEFSTSEDVIKSNGYLYQSEVALGLKVGDLTTVEQAEALEGAQGICPDGWHIPTVNEIVALVGKAVSPIETNENAPYYDKDKKNASLELLNADGFNANAWGAVSIVDNTRTSATLMGFLKTYTEGVASGYICGSSYAGVSYNTKDDTTSGVKNLQFFGFMPMMNNGTFNGSKLSYRIGASVRCVKNQ